MNTEIVSIDGSLLEGGGQILRVVLSLSALNEIPVRISNIRAGRNKPGLMEQHLKGVELVRDICRATVKGAFLGSTEIEFYPQEIRGGSYKAAVKTAGSISLLLQVALPCVLFADSPTSLILQGGTNAEMAPQIDYTTEVFRKILEKFGATFDLDLKRRGYFPKGGGEVSIFVNPIEKLNPIDITEFGQISEIYGWSFVAGTLPVKVAHIMADSATAKLKSICNKINIEKYKEDPQIAPDSASGLIIVAETDKGCILGCSGLGKRNEKSELLGERVAEELIATIKQGACIDQHAQDQVILFMALTRGYSKIRVGEITLHTKTAIHIVEMLTSAKYTITQDGTTNIIECKCPE